MMGKRTVRFKRGSSKDGEMEGQRKGKIDT